MKEFEEDRWKKTNSGLYIISIPTVKTRRAVLQICPYAVATVDYESGIGCSDRGKECWDKCKNYCLIERMIAAGYEEEKVVKEETTRELFSLFRMYIENRFGANVGVEE